MAILAVGLTGTTFRRGLIFLYEMLPLLVVRSWPHSVDLFSIPTRGDLPGVNGDNSETLGCSAASSSFCFSRCRSLKRRCPCTSSLRTNMNSITSWWRHHMEIFTALLALYDGNHRSPVDSLHKGPETQSFDVFFDLRLNKRLSKQSRRRWFEKPSPSLWRHLNIKTTGMSMYYAYT